eukprot:tig00020563_g11333.t1
MAGSGADAPPVPQADGGRMAVLFRAHASANHHATAVVRVAFEAHPAGERPVRTLPPPQPRVPPFSTAPVPPAETRRLLLETAQTVAFRSARACPCAFWYTFAFDEGEPPPGARLSVLALRDSDYAALASGGLFVYDRTVSDALGTCTQGEVHRVDAGYVGPGEHARLALANPGPVPFSGTLTFVLADSSDPIIFGVTMPAVVGLHVGLRSAPVAVHVGGLPCANPNAAVGLRAAPVAVHVGGLPCANPNAAVGLRAAPVAVHVGGLPCANPNVQSGPRDSGDTGRGLFMYQGPAVSRDPGAVSNAS